MSGGHFDYIQHYIEDAANDVLHYIGRCEGSIINEYEHDYKPEFSDATIKRFKECEAILRVASVMLERMDYLICGDDGEETYHQRLESELRQLDISIVMALGK